MWSTARTFWPLPFGHVCDVTVLVDNWNIALSYSSEDFQACSSGGLVKFTTGNVRTERMGRTDWFQGIHLGSRAHMVLPECPELLARFCLSSAGATSVPVDALLLWGDMRDKHTFCRNVPWALPQETVIVSVTNSTCQLLSFLVFDVHRQKSFVYLIIIYACIGGSDFVNVFTHSHKHAHVLVPLGHFAFNWNNTCMCYILLIFNGTLRFPPRSYFENQRKEQRKTFKK